MSVCVACWVWVRLDGLPLTCASSKSNRLARSAAAALAASAAAASTALSCASSMAAMVLCLSSSISRSLLHSLSCASFLICWYFACAWRSIAVFIASCSSKKRTLASFIISTCLATSASLLFCLSTPSLSWCVSSSLNLWL